MSKPFCNTDKHEDVITTGHCTIDLPNHSARTVHMHLSDPPESEDWAITITNDALCVTDKR